MSYNYFIPQIHLGPFSGYTFSQDLPLSKIKKLVIGKNAEFEILRKIKSNGHIIFEKKDTLFFSKKQWQNEEVAQFNWSTKKNKKELCYIETQINLLKGAGLYSSSLPGYYVHYISSNRKNFLSCGNEKYGNPRVIMQMHEFGKWIDGYPAISINKKKKTTYSIIIINPYETISLFNIEINSLNVKKSIKVPALSVKKIDFHDITKQDIWTGQFYIYGKRRAIIYLANHAFKDFNLIGTLEHTDPFRAEFTYQPRLQFLRHKIHKSLKNFWKV